MNEMQALKVARAACGATGKPYPIEVVEGTAPPQMYGESYHWETLGGRPIYHPSAYRWPKRYVASTLHIRVGRAWMEMAMKLKAGTPPEIISKVATLLRPEVPAGIASDLAKELSGE